MNPCATLRAGSNVLLGLRVRICITLGHGWLVRVVAKRYHGINLVSINQPCAMTTADPQWLSSVRLSDRDLVHVFFTERFSPPNRERGTLDSKWAVMSGSERRLVRLL